MPVLEKDGLADCIEVHGVMDIDATHLENLAQRQMFDDPSGGVFNKRIMFQFFMMAQNSNMTEKERGDVFDLLHVIALKFVSVWTQDQRFDKREKEMIAASEADPVDRRKNVPMRFVSRFRSTWTKCLSQKERPSLLRPPQ